MRHDAFAQQACEAARAADLFRRANAVHELAVIARDSVGGGSRRNLVRAELTLQKIAVLAGGGEL